MFFLNLIGLSHVTVKKILNKSQVIFIEISSHNILNNNNLSNIPVLYRE